jgi:hypothetical protein
MSSCIRTTNKVILPDDCTMVLQEIGNNKSNAEFKQEEDSRQFYQSTYTSINGEKRQGVKALNLVGGGYYKYFLM